MRDPDFIGQYGKVWRLDIDKILAKAGRTRADDGAVAAWVIYQPISHPLWYWYRMTLTHLRPHLNYPDPKIYLDGATHEFILQALNPNFYPPTVDEWPESILSPVNYADQIQCTSDEAAVKTMEELAIKPMVHGKLIADTDYIRQWAGIFGGHLLKRS